MIPPAYQLACDLRPAAGSLVQMLRLFIAGSLLLVACGQGPDGGASTRPDGAVTGDGHAGDDGSVATGCGTCDAPPTACHARIGTCGDGVCQYAFVEDATCDDGNACTVADTCSGGACTGTPLVCDAPPANVCISSTQLRTYDQVGACNGGLCTYASQVITCGSGGCSNGACVTDPCANVTCNSPPSGCFASPGTCQNGSCVYPYANGATCNDSNACTTGDSCQSGVCVGAPKSCNSPPASVCENASTLKVYSASGSCQLGSCSYSYGFASCANGCANGQCNGTGWIAMTSNVTVELKTVWASSATSVWAGGAQGTLVYYNGAQWQARSSGTAADIVQIHGTAANNVFAVAGTYQSALLHHDGTQWSTVATLPLYYTFAIFAIGTKEVLVFGRTTSTSEIYAFLRVREVAGTWQTTTLVQGAQGTVFRRPAFGYRMWAESPTSVYLPGGNYWDGTGVTKLGQATYSIAGPGRMWKSGSLVLALDWQNGNTVMYRYAPDTWTPMATGFAGNLEDFHGPSTDRIFAVGYTSSGSTTTGHVLYYDGVGWTNSPLPSGVPRLRAVWALATGEVFAVGNAGTIVKGP